MLCTQLGNEEIRGGYAMIMMKIHGIGWDSGSYETREEGLTPRGGGDQGDGHHHGCHGIVVVTRDGGKGASSLGEAGIAGFGRVVHHQVGGIHHEVPIVVR